LEFKIEEFPGIEESTDKFKPRAQFEELSFRWSPEGLGDVNVRYVAIMTIAAIATIEAGRRHGFIS